MQQMPKHDAGRNTNIQGVHSRLAAGIVFVHRFHTSHPGRNANKLCASLCHQCSQTVPFRAQNKQDWSVVAVRIANGQVLQVVQRWRIVIVVCGRDRDGGSDDAEAVFAGLIECARQVGSAVDIHYFEGTRTRRRNDGTGRGRIFRTHKDANVVVLLLSSQKVGRTQQGT